MYRVYRNNSTNEKGWGIMINWVKSNYYLIISNSFIIIASTIALFYGDFQLAERLFSVLVLWGLWLLMLHYYKKGNCK